MTGTPGMEILRMGGSKVSNTTDLGIPVTIVFSRCVSRKTVSPLYFFLKTEKAPGDRRQCLNIVLNNLTLDPAFFFYF